MSPTENDGSQRDRQVGGQRFPPRPAGTPGGAGHLTHARLVAAYTEACGEWEVRGEEKLWEQVVEDGLVEH